MHPRKILGNASGLFVENTPNKEGESDAQSSNFHALGGAVP